MSERERVDCVVVGAGPAGVSAAITMARAGLSVVLIERGDYPGAKNMFGGILFSNVLSRLTERFPADAPVERRVVRRRFSLTSADTELAFDLKTARWNSPPHNHTWTVLRARFDRWFALQAQEAGANLVCGVLVKELLTRGGDVIGVRTEPGGEELHCGCVIDAEGANALLAVQAGLRDAPGADSMALGVKEVMALERSKLEDRFNLESNEGAALHFFGRCIGGLYGSAFIYTNLDTISVGLAVSLGELAKIPEKPHQMLDAFILHPAVRRYVAGAQTLEYCAHAIPEAGYHGLPENFVAGGFIAVGDAAGLTNTSQFFEGTNLAAASGIMAGETVIEARKKGDFSRRTLREYERRLKDSFIIKDMRRFRKVKKTMLSHPQYLRDFPEALADALTHYLGVSEKPKSEVEREARRIIGTRLGRLGLLKAAWNVRSAMGSPLF